MSKNLFKKLWRKFKHKPRYSKAAFVTSLSEVPNELGSIIYIVGTSDAPKWVVLECPCGAGHKLNVNLMKSCYPRWKLKLVKDKVSLTPSLVVTDFPCQSHFWLEANDVHPAKFIGE